MIANALNLSAVDVKKLLNAASPDAALLYLYLQCGNAPQDAAAALHMDSSRLGCAGATLRQLGLWQESKPVVIPTGERPNYSEMDVIQAMEGDMPFQKLYEEIQHLLGRTLNTEELKILLGFVRYLGLPAEVIAILVCYCKDRARQKGSLRNPSLRTIEKEAYFWAERGIDTVEEAAAFIRNQNIRNSKLSRLVQQLQIRGRNLTPAEEKYANHWLEMGMEEGLIATAYERTCLNTGGLNWAYMNKILERWHSQGIHSPQQLKQGDRRDTPPQGQGANGYLGAAELDAIARVLKEG